MDLSINERIRCLYAKSGCKSVRSYALRIGVPPTTLNECIKGSEPRYSLLRAILDGEPSVSSEWLLRGEGDVVKQIAEIVSSSEADIGYTEKIAMSAMAEKIARLEKENFELRNELGHEERRAV